MSVVNFLLLYAGEGGGVTISGVEPPITTNYLIDSSGNVITDSGGNYVETEE